MAYPIRLHLGLFYSPNLMTVYQCICNYESYSKFRFNAHGRNVVGMIVAREFRNHYLTTDRLDKVLSIEPGGTFEVYDYPQLFTEVIDNVIHSYVKKCLEKKANKEIEKPRIKPVSHPTSYSSDTSKNKERKRKAVPATTQPAFSGKKLISKK
mgnify:CR=1 FL=1